jgi:hypothetical protein
MNRSTVNLVRKYAVLICRKKCGQLMKEVHGYGSDYLRLSDLPDCKSAIVKLLSDLA